MKVRITSGVNPREATDYLIQCLEEGVIGAEDVVMEFCKYCSDDVRDICQTLGLYDIEESTSISAGLFGKKKNKDKGGSSKSESNDGSVQLSKLYDIHEQYEGLSKPKSGSWTTEYAHECKTIANKFGVDTDTARDWMVEYLDVNPKKLDASLKEMHLR